MLIKSKADYSSINYDTFCQSPEVRLVDIAMLGAHDAFSNRISKKSAADPHEKKVFLRFPKIRKLFKKTIVNMSLAQTSDAYFLLTAGARFLDVRVTETKKSTYYTMHGLVSDKLQHYVEDILKFLSQNSGEVIVFGIQHIHTFNSNISELLDHLASFEYEGKTLFDYINYSAATPLGELTYGQITENGTKSAVVILAEINDRKNYDGKYSDKVYDFVSNARAYWQNDIRDKEMFDGIEREINYVKSNPDKFDGAFRINQAQKTPVLKWGTFFKFFKWNNLTLLAKQWKKVIMEKADIDRWFDTLPIFFCDHSDDNSIGFHDYIMEHIQLHNKNLASVSNQSLSSKLND